MKAIAIIVSIVLLVLCIVLCAIVLMQEAKGDGLSSAISGGNAMSTYIGRNRARTFEGKIKLITKVLGFIYLGLSMVLYLLAA